MANLPVQWTAHLDGEEKEDFEKYVRNSSSLLERLADIIDKKIDATERMSMDKDLYKSPSWAYMQADANATVRTLRDIRNLITLR